jgi:hypothetical protein
VTTPTTVAEVLDAAADMIARRGFAQRDATSAAYQDNDSPLCPGLALQWTGASSEVQADASRRFKAYLGHSDIILWSDRDGRTKEQVVSALREAAAAARAEQ